MLFRRIYRCLKCGEVFEEPKSDWLDSDIVYPYQKIETRHCSDSLQNNPLIGTVEKEPRKD